MQSSNSILRQASGLSIKIKVFAAKNQDLDEVSSSDTLPFWIYNCKITKPQWENFPTRILKLWIS